MDSRYGSAISTTPPHESSVLQQSRAEPSRTPSTAPVLGDGRRTNAEDWVVRPTSRASPPPHTPARPGRRSPLGRHPRPAELSKDRVSDSSNPAAGGPKYGSAAKDVEAALAAALSQAQNFGAAGAVAATWSSAGLLLLPEEDEDSQDEERRISSCWGGQRNAADSDSPNSASPPSGGGVVLGGPGPGLGQEDSVSSVGAAPSTPFPVPATYTQHSSPADGAAASGLFVEGAIVRAIARLSPGPEGRQGRAGSHLTGLLLSPPPAARAEAAVQASPESSPMEAEAKAGAPPAAAAAAVRAVTSEAVVQACAGSGRGPAFAERPPARPVRDAAEGAAGVALSDLGSGGAGGGGGGGGLRVVVRVGDECRASAAACTQGLPWANLGGGARRALCVCVVRAAVFGAPCDPRPVRDGLGLDLSLSLCGKDSYWIPIDPLCVVRRRRCAGELFAGPATPRFRLGRAAAWGGMSCLRRLALCLRRLVLRRLALSLRRLVLRRLALCLRRLVLRRLALCLRRLVLRRLALCLRRLVLRRLAL
jgi:hypothetical protein